MERLESTCTPLIAVGESIKGIDKLTNKELLTQFPEIDWKGAMGIRDIYYHKQRHRGQPEVYRRREKGVEEPYRIKRKRKSGKSTLKFSAKMSASDTENSLIAYTAFSGHRTKKNGL